MNIENFHFKKKFGQNFIKDTAILEKINRISDIHNSSLIIEIGPGSGVLTKKLASHHNPILAYEIDVELKEILEREFVHNSNVHFIFDDFMKRDIQSDIRDFSYQYLYVVANLPYYITTPIIEKIIREVDVYKMVIMVQKEVAERFSAKVGTKEYNALSVFLQSYFDIQLEFLVHRNCFVPQPRVDSAVVSFCKKEIPYSIIDRNHFEKFVRDCFQFKRKTLRNNLKGYDLGKIEKILKRYEHDLMSRAEMVSVSEFIEISNELVREA